MPVSPSFPTPGFPEFPQADEPRHDAVSPNFPEFPQQFPRPVSPPPLEGRGNGETHGEPRRGPIQTAAENPKLPSSADLSRATKANSLDAMTAAGAAQLGRMVPRLRRMVGEYEAGVARAALRRRLNSREKHLYDAALDLLIAAGEVVAVPTVGRRGTRYRLAAPAQQAVGPASDEETTNTDTKETDR